ncbi:HD domain-containing protein, partial [Lactococcus lactis subsp. lactis]|nr:HD domain-containing protein [Lactococcus lactis subsp. lactis]
MVLVDTGVNSSHLFWRFNLIDLKKIKRFAQE